MYARCLPINFYYSNVLHLNWKGGGNVLSHRLKLDSPDFAKAYVTSCTEMSEEIILHRCIEKIEISGAGGRVDGVFLKDKDETGITHECYLYNSPRPMGCGQSIMSFVVTKYWKREHRDWAIIAHSGTRYPPTPTDQGEGSVVVCWIAPCSINLNFPPQNGWKAVDPLARGEPKISYILNDRL